MARIRQDFPMLHQKHNGKPFIYLDSAGSCQKPKEVIERLAAFYSTEYGRPEEAHTTRKTTTEAVAETRQKVADLLHARAPEEIIFVQGATEAINVVALAFERAFLSEGDEVLITLMEHHANIVPWQLACQRTGAVLKVVPITETGELDMEALESMISERTRIISLVHSSHVLGTINPIKKITSLAHRKGIPVFVDGAQTAPHMPVDVQELDCDFYGFSAHKMGGPTGVGVLYGKAAWLNKMPPYQGGAIMAETVTFENAAYAPLPLKFEAGTTAYADIIAFGTLLDYLERVGHKAIEAYEQHLLYYAGEKLRRIAGLHILGAAPEREPVLTFTLEGADVSALEIYLNDKYGIAVRVGEFSAQPLMQYLGLEKAVRVSFALCNTEEEIDTLVEAIQTYQKEAR